MKNILVSLVLAWISASLWHFPAVADAAELGSDNFPASLCIPGVYLDGEPDCQLLGPAAHATQIAYIEDQIASQPERFPTISEEYGESEFNYFRVNESSNHLFYSLDTAVANTASVNSMYEGYTFASYTSMVEMEGKKYFQLGSGEWMRGAAVGYYAAPNQFLGVQPLEQPTRKFGWVLKDTPTLTEPGYYALRTGNIIPRYTLVEVFDHQRIGLSDWYMLALDEWVHMTQVALVYPAEGPPNGVENGRWIEINIFEQTLSVYENNQLVFATLVTSGSSRNYTRPGLFKIYEKLETTTMAGDLGQDGAYYLMDVPWTMYFDDRRALHAEYWHDHLGYKSSHGCVNMSFPDSDWLFRWAQYGEWVYAWDPSGLTPEDPKLFTQHLGD
ncbi:MAG: L,D-transpeptidase [Anaerolineales bacterium]|nr:L,D-transpeptidase [Anaerolineales bacterium]